MDRPARAPALHPRGSGMVTDTAARAQSVDDRQEAGAVF
jgi:hypothetical protein